MALLRAGLLFVYSAVGLVRIFVHQDGGLGGGGGDPAALLGLLCEREYSPFCWPRPRLQSFAREPSLNIVYFMIPAALALLVPRRRYFTIGVLIAIYCLLSLSGSVFLTCGFMALWWCLLRLVSLRFAFSFGLLGLLGA